MEKRDEPTEITRSDIDKVMKDWQEKQNEPTPMTTCNSCNKELPVLFVDYFTGQCQDCFFSRKPWIKTSPVSGSFFVIEDKT